MSTVIEQRTTSGNFAVGNTIGGAVKGQKHSAKQLKQLMIDTLNELGPSGATLIQDVIRVVSRDKPEALLPFAGKLIPSETEQTIVKFSPIVFNNEVQQVEALIDEPLVIEAVKPAVIAKKKRVANCSINRDDDL